MNEIIEKLNVLLATSFTMYLKTHFFHWNVKGQDFIQYHNFFGDLYQDVFGSVDSTAEEIRALDGVAYGSLSQYQSLTKVEDQTSVPNIQQMVSILYRDNETVLEALKEVHEAAQRHNQYGLNNYIEERMDIHKKHGWMLRASMAPTVKEEVSDEVKTYAFNPSEL